MYCKKGVENLGLYNLLDRFDHPSRSIGASTYIVNSGFDVYFISQSNVFSYSQLKHWQKHRTDIRVTAFYSWTHLSTLHTPWFDFTSSSLVHQPPSKYYIKWKRMHRAATWCLAQESLHENVCKPICVCPYMWTSKGQRDCPGWTRLSEWTSVIGRSPWHSSHQDPEKDWVVKDELWVWKNVQQYAPIFSCN